MKEEMGMDVELKEAFSFIYKAPFDNGLTEHEYDHVMIGYSNEDPVINPDEVADWKWVDAQSLRVDIKKNPENYTEWFKIIFDKFYQKLQSEF